MHHTNIPEQIKKLLLPLNATLVNISDESHMHAGHKPNNELTITKETKGTHIRALIVSDEFDGMSRVKRHQKIYQLLSPLMDNPIHALALKIFTPNEHQNLSE